MPHIFPFHICIALGRPDLELDDRNLITPCGDELEGGNQDHHLLIGHLDSFASWNGNVEMDGALAVRGKTAEEIRRSPRWHATVLHRPMPLGKLSDGEKRVLAQVMNER